MKKSIIYLLTLVALLLVLDRLGGLMMSECYRHTHAKAEVKIQHLINRSSENIVLLGNSRCAYHYVPSVISDSLHMSVYNGGIDGSENIYSQYIMICHLLAHHTPKIICIETDGNDFNHTEDAFKKTSYFAPLFGINAQADSVFRDAGTYRMYQVSSLYRYNAKSIEILGGMLLGQERNNDNGYFPIQGERQVDLQLIKGEYSLMKDENKISYVEKIARMCAERDIILVWVISPAYREVEEEIFAPIRQFAQAHNNLFFDYYTTGLFRDHPEYFKDNGHLLDNGARIYSSIFAHDLKIAIENNSKLFE